MNLNDRLNMKCSDCSIERSQPCLKCVKQICYWAIKDGIVEAFTTHQTGQAIKEAVSKFQV